MAHAKFPAEVVTPEGEVFSEEIEMLFALTAHLRDEIVAAVFTSIAAAVVIFPLGLQLYTALGSMALIPVTTLLAMLATKRDRNPPKKHGNIPL